MSRISNEWVKLEMREGIFKDKLSWPGRVLFFLCMFILLFLWCVPVSAMVQVDRDAVGSNMVRSGKVLLLIPGGVDKAVL